MLFCTTFYSLAQRTNIQSNDDGATYSHARDLMKKIKEVPSNNHLQPADSNPGNCAKYISNSSLTSLLSC